MRTALKVLGWIGVALIVVIAVGYAVLWRGDIPYAQLEAKYANAQSRFMDLPGGVRVHYRDEGPRGAPALLMIHGYSASLEAWTPWTAILKDHWRIIRLDLPGHGLTRAPKGYRPTMAGYADLADTVAERLGAGRYVVIGNSMGGQVAWTDALRHADHVRGLVLVDSGGWPEPRNGRQGPPPLIFAILANPIGRAVIKNLDNRALVTAALKDAYLDPKLVTPAVVDRYVLPMRAPGHRDILLALGAGEGMAPGNAAMFARIAAPTLVMSGQEDRLVPVADAQGFARAIPGARLVTYPRVGHVPMEQIPARSAAGLEAFLDSIGAPAQALSKTG
ncbi:MAG TPA: alpha/beta hydrolase [Caulobacteraceae bacterium]|nr:alpha/beta hydrolase [Caulobacteraceae bacterium]